MRIMKPNKSWLLGWLNPKVFLRQMNSSCKSLCKTKNSLIVQLAIPLIYLSHKLRTLCLYYQNDIDASSILPQQKNYGGNLSGVLGLQTRFVTLGKSPNPRGFSFPTSVERVFGEGGGMTPTPQSAPIKIYTFQGANGYCCLLLEGEKDADHGNKLNILLLL